jgi:hypothetical protein
MTLNRFFALFLAVSFIIYFGISPYVIDQKKLQDIPQLEFESFASYEIIGENLNVIIDGKSVKRYENRLLFKDFVLHQEANNSVRYISAKSGLYEEKEILLTNSVQYGSGSGMILETNKAKYDLKHNILDIQAPFRLTQDSSVLTGSSLLFNQNNDRIEAKDVKASLDIK